MLILSIESGSMCEDQGSSEQSGLLQLSLAAEQNPMWNNMAVHTTWKKRKMIVQPRRDFFMLLFPLPLARNKENIETRTL